METQDIAIGQGSPEPNADRSITLFLCGDVMTGRGVDQILPDPGKPELHEPSVTDARQYVQLAEQANGPIPRSDDYSYIWGDALPELRRRAPDVRVINLETSITTSDDYWPGKGIHYRMNPANVACLAAAGIDCCCLANNHVLDWGHAGLAETLHTLDDAGIRTAGAGRNLSEARAPACLDVPGKGRVLVFSFGLETSGVPASWAAGPDAPGVNFLADSSQRTVEQIAEAVARTKHDRDIVVVSLHWGGNWGYDASPVQRAFAHQLIDRAGVDVIHGHSSHHVKGIEIHRGRPILYGCGDLLTDYEGIRGYETFRDDLGLLYFVHAEASTGKLLAVEMTPTQIHRMRLRRAGTGDARWLEGVLNREGRRFGTRVDRNAADNTLVLRWGETA